MAKKDEIVDEEVIVEEESSLKKEDAPHKAFREIMALYEKQNPEKFATKQAEFARKLAGKLAFAVTEDGKILNGAIDPTNGKRAPLEIKEVK